MTSVCYCFSERSKEARLVLLMGPRNEALAVGGETTRKWRRKSLESLKADSGMAMSRVPVPGDENGSADSVSQPRPLKLLERSGAMR